jgi:hypothetical protein
MKRHTSRDPIFAAIAEHQKVAAALMVAFKHKWRLEDKLGGKAYDGDDPKWIAAEKLKTRLGARDAAAFRLVRIKPTSPDGAIALLNFADIGADDVPPISDRAAKKLGAPFGCIVARARASGPSTSRAPRSRERAGERDNDSARSTPNGAAVLWARSPGLVFCIADERIAFRCRLRRHRRLARSLIVPTSSTKMAGVDSMLVCEA